MCQLHVTIRDKPSHPRNQGEKKQNKTLKVNNEGEIPSVRSCPTLCNSIDYTVHGIFQARILEWVAFSFSKGSSQPGIKPRSPTLQADSVPAEPPGKPKNTGVGSLSLLQGIFPTQESNQGLLHCRWILYLLSYQGSPKVKNRLF